MAQRKNSSDWREFSFSHQLSTDQCTCMKKSPKAEKRSPPGAHKGQGIIWAPKKKKKRSLYLHREPGTTPLHGGRQEWAVPTSGAGLGWPPGLGGKTSHGKEHLPRLCWSSTACLQTRYLQRVPAEQVSHRWQSNTCRDSAGSANFPRLFYDRVDDEACFLNFLKAE